MNNENALLMAKAREVLTGKWGLAVGGCFLYMLISLIVAKPKDIGNILALLIDGPMLFGLSVFSLALARRQEAKISQLFVGFNDYIRTLVLYILMMVFILLWSLLLIIPGIIAGLAYSQAFFILTEDKNIKPMDALRKSKAMMNGHKKELFFLGLRFFGWLLLCIATFGIGFLWLLPYFQTTMALYYDKIKNSNQSAPEALPA